MQPTNQNTDDAVDLKRYRQAADVAYQYAKNKIEQERAPKTEPDQQDVFGNQDKQES